MDSILTSPSDAEESLFPSSPEAEAKSSVYQVLARKYRPVSFSDLIGQDALVRTLSNAIQKQRIAHAFLLTGIRGVGKTTTARIIARALNCIGADGKSGPTTEPCGVCTHCTSIREDRHQDVLEMDAASRTGINDIREIIENTRYLPTSARYKIYIIDEVHMLSNSAFNALLKTLEEPPAHVKFIFATTEIRKIPVTILSRCQRFDLPRIVGDVLSAHLKKITEKENHAIDDEALALVTQAAEGSVRDGLSLLDQAIAYSNTEGDGKTITANIVREMLGVADKGAIFTLFGAVVEGRIQDALAQLRNMYQSGGDPILIMQDLLELVNLITRMRVTPELAASALLTEMERKEGKKFAETLSVPFLSRSWQIVLKGLQETQQAPNALMAAEMVIVRLAYVSDLPSPGDLIKTLKKQGTTGQGGSVSVATASPAPLVKASQEQTFEAVSYTPIADGNTAREFAVLEEPAPVKNTALTPIPIETFSQLVALFAHYNEPLLYHTLREEVHLVHFADGKIEFRPAPSASPELAGRVSQYLHQWTGRRWGVVISKQPGEPTLAEQEEELKRKQKDEVARHATIRPLLEAFPGAKIISFEKYKK